MDLKIDEGRVYGAKYYTVNPLYAPFWYDQSWHDMEKWTIKTFGPTPKDGVWTPGARWYMNDGKFWFRNKKDLEWFILKWQ